LCGFGWVEHCCGLAADGLHGVASVEQANKKPLNRQAVNLFC